MSLSIHFMCICDRIGDKRPDNAVHLYWVTGNVGLRKFVEIDWGSLLEIELLSKNNSKVLPERPCLEQGTFSQMYEKNNKSNKWIMKTSLRMQPKLLSGHNFRLNLYSLFLFNRIEFQVDRNSRPLSTWTNCGARFFRNQVKWTIHRA